MVVHVYTVPGHNKCLCSPSPWKWLYMSTLPGHNICLCSPSPWKWLYMSTLPGHNKCLCSPSPLKWLYMSTQCLVTTNAYVLHHPGNGCTCLHSAWSQQMPVFSITLEMVVHVYTVPGHNKCLCSPSPWKWLYMSTLPGHNKCLCSPSPLKWLYMSTQCLVTTNAYVLHHPGNGCTCLHSVWSQQMPVFSITQEMVVHVYTAWSQQMPMFSITLEMVVHVYTVPGHNKCLCSPSPLKWLYMSTVPGHNKCLCSPSPLKWSYMSTQCLVTTNAYVLHHPGNGCTCLHSAWSQQMPMFSITLEMVVHVYTVPGHNKCLCSPSSWKWLYMSTQCQVTTNAYVLHHP